MSLRAMLWAFDEAPPTTALDKLVLIALADEADDNGGSCFPSIRRIATRTGLSLGGVRNHLTTLETAGLITIERPAKTGRGHHNRYRLNLDKRAGDAPSEKRAQTRADPQETRANARPEARVPVDPLPVDPKEETLVGDVDDALCQHMADAIEQTHGKQPKITKAWATSMHLLRTRGPVEWATPEPIPPDMIRAMIAVALKHDFWSKNIRSPSSLRKYWERLRLDCRKQTPGRQIAAGIKTGRIEL